MQRRYWVEFAIVFLIFAFIPYFAIGKSYQVLVNHSGLFPISILFADYSKLYFALPLIAILVLVSRLFVVSIHPLISRSFQTPFKYWCAYQGSVFGSLVSLITWWIINPTSVQRILIFRGDFILISAIGGGLIAFFDSKTKQITSRRSANPFLVETPIETEDEDVIQIGPVVDEVTSAIRASFEGKRKVIAVFGKNGIGKTSVINLVRSKLQKENFFFRNFEPYKYTSEKEMIKNFFSAMLDPLDCKYILPRANTISKQLTSILSGFSGEVPVVKFDFGKIGDWFANSDDFTSLKSVIEQYLLDLDEKIVIVVDDLDRCSIRKRHLFFQLVNAIKSLENIVIVITASVDELLELKQPEVISIVD